jgi:hypothetical protein
VKKGNLPLKCAWSATDHLIGKKNGKRFGMKLNIVEKCKKQKG